MSIDDFLPLIGLLVLFVIIAVPLRAIWAFLSGLREGYVRGPLPKRPVLNAAHPPDHPDGPPASVAAPTSPSSVPSAAASAGNIFISYRREDSQDVSGRIYDRLVAQFDREHIYKDVDALPLGDDFRVHLEDAVEKATVVLAVIGPRWSGTASTRLNDPRDFVRIEISAALRRNIPVVPVLVSGASMPTESELPEELISLVYRHAIHVRPDPDFHNDVDRLIKGISRLLSRIQQHGKMGTNHEYPANHQ